MAKKETCEKLIRTGLEIFLVKGFNNTGIKELLAASGIPKGSFYFHYKNKEDFGLAVIDRYTSEFIVMADRYREECKGSYLRRLREFLKWRKEQFEKSGFRGGCLVGNLSCEMSDQSEVMRAKLHQALNSIIKTINEFLVESKNRGELRVKNDPCEIAEFIFQNWQGALMCAKAEKSSRALQQFDRLIFDVLLKP